MTAFGEKLPPAFHAVGSASFLDFLAAQAPDLLPGRLTVPAGAQVEAPHGTTIVALRYPGGIVMAGDRRATMGNVIASRDIEKVFAADDYSAVGIAGSAGLAVELVRLFQLELEHYEKIEGSLLSLDGKANRLATMIRSNLGLAMQGLAVVPVFGGYDLASATGRIFSFDVTGGRYEERDFYAIGSGSPFARGALKKLWHADLSRDQAAGIAIQALVDAADDDSATGGIDRERDIWPVVAIVDEGGYRRLADGDLAALLARVTPHVRGGAARGSSARGKGKQS